MKLERVMMGMPVCIEVVDPHVTEHDIEAVFEYYNEVDMRFSTYKTESEISKINRGEVLPHEYSPEMQEVFALSEETKKLTKGYFDIKRPGGLIDPSGLVKGWMIHHGAQILLKRGFTSLYVEIAGDIQTHGKNPDGEFWRIGIKNPFNTAQIVKVVKLSGQGIATSGTYERGEHIWKGGEVGRRELDEQKRPRRHDTAVSSSERTNKGERTIASVSIIAKNIYEADRFATAIFAMGEKGIMFAEKYPGLEGYIIDSTGRATMTSGFEKFL